jgi:RNA polymerase sigma-70 factor (ECF subfamily)
VVSEEEAISRLRQGDITGLETLVALHQVRAVRLATVITRDPQLAQDVASASFLAAFEGIDGFDPHRPFRPWFLRIVVNKALKAFADQLRFATLDEYEGTSFLAEEALSLAGVPASNPASAAISTEVREEIRQALGSLTTKQRTVVVLRYYAGMSEAEIAEALGIPDGTVKSRGWAAMQRLRRLLVHVRDWLTS